jgi:hypothetical protein
MCSLFEEFWSVASQVLNAPRGSHRQRSAGKQISAQKRNANHNAAAAFKSFKEISG